MRDTVLCRKKTACKEARGDKIGKVPPQYQIGGKQFLQRGDSLAELPDVGKGLPVRHAASMSSHDPSCSTDSPG